MSTSSAERSGPKSGRMSELPLLSRKERISFRNYDLRRAALNELTFFSLCIFVRYRSATPCLLFGSVLERLSITETRVIRDNAERTDSGAHHLNRRGQR